MKKHSKQGLCILISVLMMVIGILGAKILQTDFGRVDIRNVSIDSQSGYTLSMDVYVPESATAEDPAATDEWLAGMVGALKAAHPGCAVTLSVGERSRESYERLRAAGADRYLLRHETATAAHYRQLHPAVMTLQRRMACLSALREAGFAVGAGFMVGSPFQTAERLAADLAFVQEFRPEMCGIGPFVPHRDTPFAAEAPGTVELTCYLLSLVRLAHPTVLLPATTALEALDPHGREKGILAGANVVMPNLSPPEHQGDYALYDGKPRSSAGAARKWADLAAQLEPLGRRLVVDRGNPMKEKTYDSL